MSPVHTKRCSSCKKAVPGLRICGKCYSASYCSLKCQRADWKMHKTICDLWAQTRARAMGEELDNPRPCKGLEKPIFNVLTRLHENTYLYDRPEMDVYRILIESYRLYLQDQYRTEGRVAADSIYNGQNDSLVGFTRYLSLAGLHENILPPWWNSEKEEECKRLGMDFSNWYSLRTAIEVDDIIRHYGDTCFPWDLRYIYHQITGRQFPKEPLLADVGVKALERVEHGQTYMIFAPIDDEQS